MKAKFFQTFDPIYHKKVEAVNIIMTPEEKESFQKGLGQSPTNEFVGLPQANAPVKQAQTDQPQ